MASCVWWSEDTPLLRIPSPCSGLHSSPRKPLGVGTARALASQISVLELKKALRGWSPGKGAFPFRNEQLCLADCLTRPSRADLQIPEPWLPVTSAAFSFPGSPSPAFICLANIYRAFISENPDHSLCVTVLTLLGGGVEGRQWAQNMVRD